MIITVVGMGYVGASSAVLLARKHEVVAVDNSRKKREAIEKRQAPIADELMDELLHDEDIDIRVSEDMDADYRISDLILVAVPTNYNKESGTLDTTTVEKVVSDIVGSGSRASIVIKSTIPMGFMDELQNRYPHTEFMYVPEFLRENSAMYDQLHPSRIVIGLREKEDGEAGAGNGFADVMKECIEDSDVPFIYMSFGEAEAVKLFSNTYLAMRIAFFNELDTLAESQGYDTEGIIRGICMDPRIGDHYNNPSFGYGGYCLPKDTRQLLRSYGGIPQDLIGGVVRSNETRMDFIADSIIRQVDRLREAVSEEDGGRDPVVGVYRLIMKTGSTNSRESSVINVIEKLRKRCIDVVIYEPIIGEGEQIEGCELIEDLEDFKRRSDLIIANRRGRDIDDVSEKVYTRDVFFRN